MENNLEKNPFGICPWCGKPLAWDSDSEWAEDENVTIRFCHCSHCGCEVEAMECIPEERHNYPDYWKDVKPEKNL